MTERNERFLVTGCAGFIGGHIARRLIGDGLDVVGIDDFSTGKPENIADIRDRFHFIEGTLCDMDLACEACKGITYVLHQAAIPSVHRSLRHPIVSLHASVTATVTLLQAAVKMGVKRIIQAGSSSAYGDTEKLPKVEAMSPNPLSPYAVAKLTQEYYASAFSHCFDIETVNLRYFNVFGPGQDPNSEYSAVIPKFITGMLRHKPPVIFGDGKQSRDFTYIDNVVEGNMLAVSAKGPFRGDVINIACGDRISLLQLVDILNNILGANLRPVHKPARAGDVRHSQACIKKSNALLGFKPMVDFEEGLRRTVNYYRSLSA